MIITVYLDKHKQVPPEYTGIVQRPTRKAWYFEGKLHRTDGPAREWAEGSKTWWLLYQAITNKTSILLVI